MYINIIILVLLVLIIWFWIFFAFFYKKKAWLSDEQIKKFTKRLKLINSPSYTGREKILELDKLYHHILKQVWFSWTFWEILKQNPSYISDIDEIWRLHKIRNKLAHDMDEISIVKLRKEAKNYIQETEKLIKTLK